MDFDFFVIQVLDKPFGMAWYQGDIQTDGTGTEWETLLGALARDICVCARCDLRA